MNPNAPQHRTIHFLTNIADCAGCRASMLDTGQHYACPQETAQGPGQCATLPVRCGQLDRMVLQFLVNTLVTPDALNLQAELLGEDSARDSQPDHARHDKQADHIPAGMDHVAFWHRQRAPEQTSRPGVETLGGTFFA